MLCGAVDVADANRDRPAEDERAHRYERERDTNRAEATDERVGRGDRRTEHVAREDERRLIDVASRPHRREQTRDDLLRRIVLDDRFAEFSILDATMRAVGTEQETIAREQFDVGDRGFELGLRSETAPQQPARTRFCKGRHLRARDGGIGEHRVVRRKHFEATEAREIRTRVTDVSDERVRANDEHGRERGPARDKIFIASAELVKFCVRVIESGEQQRTEITRREIALEGAEPLPTTHEIADRREGERCRAIAATELAKTIGDRDERNAGAYVLHDVRVAGTAA